MGRKRSQTSPIGHGKSKSYQEFDDDSDDTDVSRRQSWVEQSPGKHGGKNKSNGYEEFDGPNKQRGCTDILCLVIFVAFVIFMIYLLIYGLAFGDLDRLTHGYDVSGNVCGRQNNKQISGVPFSGLNEGGRPFLQFDIIKTGQILSGFVPYAATTQTTATNTTQSSTTNNNYNSTFVRNINYCYSGTNATTAPPVASRLVEADRDSGIISLPQSNSSGQRTARSATTGINSNEALQFLSSELDTDPVALVVTGGGACRYCVSQCSSGSPAYLSRCIPLGYVLNDTASIFYSGSGLQDFFSHAMADVKLSYPVMIYMAIIALGLALLMTLLLRFLAAFVIIVVVVLSMLACIAGTVFLWVIYGLKQRFYNAAQDGNATRSLQENESVEQMQQSGAFSRLTSSFSQTDVNNFLGAAICATILTVIIFLILLVLRKRLALVAQLFTEAGHAVIAMPLILLQPMWTLLSLVIALSFWILGLLMLESAGSPESNPLTGFVTYDKNPFMDAMRWVYLFGILWTAQFLISCQHMVIAGAVAEWYFAKEKNKLGFPIWRSFFILIRYHLGSVALGSFIIALVRFIRVVLYYVERQVQKQHDKGFCGCCGTASAVMMKPLLCCLKCCECCVWCFEKVIKFITKNAYIMIAINGDNFCTSARKAFATLTSNALRVAAINSVGTFVLFLSKVVIVVATCVAGAAIVNNLGPDSDGRVVVYMWIPVTLGGIFAYVIAQCFIEVYGMAIDTIFLCFCEDSELNDGNTKPYFMSKGLMHFVNNSHKAIVQAEKGSKNENDD